MKKSAGLLVYRFISNELEVFLVHPGGPFWRNKDLGAWSIPKGEFLDGEDPLEAAKREFIEETSQQIEGEFFRLTELKQPSGKLVYAWAVKGSIDTQKITSNKIEINWPPKSDKKILIPEIDKGEWFTIQEASVKILKGQLPFLSELSALIE